MDLCWGRFDTHEHPIYEPANDEQNYLFPGIDYSNARIRDFDKVEDYLTESCDRKKELRMPWHDVHSRLIGPVVADIARHFVERWNFSRFGTGSGITDIKQNASVSNERIRLEDTNTLDDELNKKQKNAGGGFLMGIINQVNEKEKREKELQEKQGALVPEDENKSSDDSSNNINLEGKKKKLFSGLYRGKKKENKDTDSSEKEKEGYNEEKELREKFMQDKEEIDEDHLYVSKKKNEKSGTKLRGRRLQNNIKKIRDAKRKSAFEIRNNFQMEINTESRRSFDDDAIDEKIEQSFQEEEEENKPKKTSYYHKLVKNMGNLAKKNKGGWFSKMINSGQQEEKNWKQM